MDEQFNICPRCHAIVSDENRVDIDWQDYELIDEFGQDGIIHRCLNCGFLGEMESIMDYEFQEYREQYPVVEWNKECDRGDE